MEDLTIKSNYEDMARNAINAGVDYLKDNREIKTLIIGVSGGIDSALTAVLARRICEVVGDVKLHGFFLPITGNEKDEWSRAEDVGSAVCHSFRTITDLDKAYIDLLMAVDYTLYSKLMITPAEITFDDKVRLGNIKARIRMIYLYNQARARKGLVLSTDNLTEYYLGFWTQHGDEGDLGIIQNLWKTEVYGLAKAVGGPIAQCIGAKPTDGLGITDSDLSQLLPDWQGSYIEGYNVIDNILINYIGKTENMVSPDHAVIRHYEGTHFKRNRPFNVKRGILTSVW